MFLPVFLSSVAPFVSKKRERRGCFPKEGLTHRLSHPLPPHTMPTPNPVLSHVGAACPWAWQEFTSGRGTPDLAEARRQCRTFRGRLFPGLTALLSPPPSTGPSASRKPSTPYTLAQDSHLAQAPPSKASRQPVALVQTPTPPSANRWPKPQFPHLPWQVRLVHKDAGACGWLFMAQHSQPERPGFSLSWAFKMGILLMKRKQTWRRRGRPR